MPRIAVRGRYELAAACVLLATVGGCATSGGPGGNPTPVPTPAAGPSRLFVADATGPDGEVFAFVEPGDVDGARPADRTVSQLRAQAGAFGATAVAVNSAGELLVLGAETIAGSDNWIAVFDNAAQADGLLTPTRRVIGPQSQLSETTAMAIDRDADVLFVALFDSFSSGPREILVFEDTSTAAFDGDLAPARTFHSPAMFSPQGMHTASTGELYVAEFSLLGSENKVLVFADAANLDDEVDPSRTITGDELREVRDVFVDAADNLFVLDDRDQRVLIFADAPTLGEGAVPIGIVEVVGASLLRKIVVDTDGTGYISDNVRGTIYVYDSLATRDGALEPDRTIDTRAIGMEQPWGMFLLE